MGTRTQDLIVLAVASFAAIGCAYYYIVAVLDQHRTLFRSAALAFFLFSLVVAMFVPRLL